MAALVQAYPQSSGAVTVVQTQPPSAPGMLPAQAQPSQQYGHGSGPQRNSVYGAQGAVVRPVVYRGTTAPVQPYAFTSTPSLNHDGQWQQFRPSRTSSMPAVVTVHNNPEPHQTAVRPRYVPSASMTNLPTTTPAAFPPGFSRDDSSVPSGIGARRVAAAPRPQSAYFAPTYAQATLPQTQAGSIRVSPERYRRSASRTVDPSVSAAQIHPQSSAPPSGSGMASVGHLYSQRNVAEQTSDVGRNHQNRPHSFVGAIPGSAADDMQLNRASSQEEAKRFRRRSLPALDFAALPILDLTPLDNVAQPVELFRPRDLAAPKNVDRELQKPARLAVENNRAVHIRNGSSESVVSSRSSSSRPSSANRSNNVATPTGNPALNSSTGFDRNQDNNKLVNIPPRGSSSDAAATKRAANPSPLSKPVSMDPDREVNMAAGSANAAAATPASPQKQADSPALKRLAAINEKGGKPKSKTSRLRRAFSFGSAAELRKNAGGAPETDQNDGSRDVGPAKLHKTPTPGELYDAEQERIAKKQEESGLGNSIYSGGRFFAGSTDNISISSTASSASVMIRKMGRGMKKGGRSLVGIFRPKSDAPDPSAEVKAPEASQATVSMVTVEAERQRVNVNPDVSSQNGGGTGFPRLERNSIDASKAPSAFSERRESSGTDNSSARKSIVGGEKERAEVLAAVRKGILKHANESSSPKSETRSPGLDLPNVPQISDSPSSSAPSTPNDDAQGHRRTGSIAIGSEDYFVSALRLRQDSKGNLETPQGVTKRNATFSPRIIFYDTWPSAEYDRRGDIATCNRLTPMLAQQIKEELNNLKMEMEVHENSKIYTQFF